MTATAEAPPAVRPLAAALAVTLAVAAISHFGPDAYANTAVGAVFLGATWWLVLRGDDEDIAAHGLSLGGLTEPEPLSPGRLAREGAVAVAWGLLFALVIFPPFVLGYAWWWEVRDFTFRLPADVGSIALNQLLVIALPEEAFYRGYLQSQLEGAWAPKRRRILGVELGAGWLVAAMIFAVGHVLTIPHPSRLAVFFPALAFGWLRAKTGGIGAGIVFHALSNMLTTLLAAGFNP